MYRTTGAAQDAVSENAVTLVGEDRAGTTPESEVRNGVVATTPTPHHQEEQIIQGGGQDCRYGGRLA